MTQVSNGQHHTADYTRGADTARVAASWLDNGPNRIAVYELVRDTLNKRDATIEQFAQLLESDGFPSVLNALNELLCCNGHHCGCLGVTVGEYLAHELRKAISE